MDATPVTDTVRTPVYTPKEKAKMTKRSERSKRKNASIPDPMTSIARAAAIAYTETNDPLAEKKRKEAAIRSENIVTLEAEFRAIVAARIKATRIGPVRCNGCVPSHVHWEPYNADVPLGECKFCSGELSYEPEPNGIPLYQCSVCNYAVPLLHKLRGVGNRARYKHYSARELAEMEVDLDKDIADISHCHQCLGAKSCKFAGLISSSMLRALKDTPPMIVPPPQPQPAPVVNNTLKPDMCAMWATIASKPPCGDSAQCPVFQTPPPLTLFGSSNTPVESTTRSGAYSILVTKMCGVLADFNASYSSFPEWNDAHAALDAAFAVLMQKYTSSPSDFSATGTASAN